MGVEAQTPEIGVGERCAKNAQIPGATKGGGMGLLRGPSIGWCASRAIAKASLLTPGGASLPFQFEL